MHQWAKTTQKEILNPDTDLETPPQFIQWLFASFGCQLFWITYCWPHKIIKQSLFDAKRYHGVIVMLGCDMEWFISFITQTLKSWHVNQPHPHNTLSTHNKESWDV